MEEKMLRRPDLHVILKADTDGVVMDHYIRAVHLRLRFCGVKLPWIKKGKVSMPSCHVVAHAYAKAFSVEAVDGEHAYLQSRGKTKWLRRMCIDISTYMHSWNIIRFHDDLSIILDIFPDEGCPMMPVLLRHPHPAYWVPVDNEFQQKIIRKIAADEQFHTEVGIVAKEFLRIEKDHNVTE